MAGDPPEVPRTCSLDAAGLEAQLGRYRRAGEGASLIQADPLRLELVVGPGADQREVAELVAVERECCPFFAIDWVPESRRLSFEVAAAEDSPALDGIAHALGLEGQLA